MFAFHLKQQLKSKPQRLKGLLFCLVLIFGLLMNHRLQDQKVAQMDSVYTNLAKQSQKMIETYQAREDKLDKASTYALALNKEYYAGSMAYLEGNYNQYMHHMGQGSKIMLEAREDGCYFAHETKNMTIDQVYHLTKLHQYYMNEGERLGLDTYEEAIGMTGLYQLTQFLSTYESNNYLLIFTMLFILTFSLDLGLKRRSRNTLLATIPKSSASLISGQIFGQLLFVCSLQYVFVLLYFIGTSLRYGAGYFGRYIPLFVNGEIQYVRLLNYLILILIFHIILNLLILLFIALMNQLFQSSFLTIIAIALLLSVESFAHNTDVHQTWLLPFQALNFPKVINGFTQIVHQNPSLTWSHGLFALLACCILLYALNLILAHFQDKKQVMT